MSAELISCLEDHIVHRRGNYVENFLTRDQLEINAHNEKYIAIATIERAMPQRTQPAFSNGNITHYIVSIVWHSTKQ